MAQSAAFAGANAVIVGGQVGQQPGRRSTAAEEDIVVSGIGIISSLGLSVKDFMDRVSRGDSGLSSAQELQADLPADLLAGLVKDFNPRKLMPTLNLRRVDKVAAYATIASSLALQDAKLWPVAGDGGQIGLVVGVSRGAATSYEKYLNSVKGGNWSAASAVFFPNLVMSSVGGQVTSSLGIRGITSSLVGAGSAGLQALTHALELFKRNPMQDAVIVVASDELAPLYFQLFERLNLLHHVGRNHCPTMNLGEGSVAWVLERASKAAARGARVWGRVRSYGLTADANLPTGIEPTGKWLRRAIESALASGEVNINDVALRYHLSSGRCPLDRREHEVLSSLFGSDACFNSVTPQTGYAEASSSLMNATAALANLHGMGTQTQPSEGQVALVIASGEEGSHAAVCLDRVN